MAQVSDPRNFDPVRVFGGGMLAARVFPSDPAREPVGLLCPRGGGATDLPVGGGESLLRSVCVTEPAPPRKVPDTSSRLLAQGKGSFRFPPSPGHAHPFPHVLWFPLPLGALRFVSSSSIGDFDQSFSIPRPVS